MRKNNLCGATYRLLTFTLIALVASTTFLGSHCSAAMFGFERITSNGTENPESQISVDVSDSAGRVLFKFSNAGPTASNITEIYWDDDSSLLSNGPDIDAGSTSAGVTFLPNASTSPPELPGGNDVGFSADHSIDSQNGNGNGIQPGEMAGFLFDGNVNTVISAINAGTLKMGMHVRSIGTAGESEGFVNVPEPSALALLVVGFLGIAVRSKRS